MTARAMGSYEIDERLYVNTLYFEPATFLNVGYYYCVKKAAITEEFSTKLNNQWKEVGFVGCAAHFWGCVASIYQCSVSLPLAKRRFTERFREFNGWK